MRRSLLAPLAILLAAPALALGAPCARASGAPAPAICSGPQAHATATEFARLLTQLAAAAPSAMRARLAAGERAWAGGGKGVAENCDAPPILTRRDALRALAATISDANPTLTGTRAAWLEGSYRLASPHGTGGFAAPSHVPGLLPAGTVLVLSAGQACQEASCGAFGLIPEALAAGPGRADLPTRLRLPADTPFFLVMQDGQASFGLVIPPGGSPFALAPACAPSGDPCGWVRQGWKATPGAKLHETDLAAP